MSGSVRTVIKTQPKRGEDDVYHEDPECRYLGHATTAREVPRSSISGQRRPCSACSLHTDNGRDDHRTDGGLPDDSSMRCYNCERVIDRRHIGYHKVPMHDEDGLGYEMVPVPLCEECQRRWFGVECPNCGDYHWDVEGVFECKRDRPRLMPDGGLLMATDDPHAEPLLVTDADGLHLPESYIGYEGGLVARMPNGATIDFKPREWGGTVGNVVPRRFGEVNEEGPNDHLEADQVSLKKYGEEPEVFRVEVRR